MEKAFACFSKRAYKISHPTSQRPLKFLGKNNIYLASCSYMKKKVWFKESPPSIMVTRNPNWSIQILWSETSYVKRKILSPLKRPTLSRLHCQFFLKLLRVVLFCFLWFAYNILDSGASEYSTTNTSNSSIGKYYVIKKWYSWLWRQWINQ